MPTSLEARCGARLRYADLNARCAGAFKESLEARGGARLRYRSGAEHIPLRLPARQRKGGATGVEPPSNFPRRLVFRLLARAWGRVCRGFH